MGDFNTQLNADESTYGSSFLTPGVADFRECVRKLKWMMPVTMTCFSSEIKNPKAQMVFSRS